MSKNEALLIIDYTNDFVADQGALTCGKPGQIIAAEIIRLANEMLAADGWVILPTDVHTPKDPYHPESKLFLPHNVRDSWGREFYGPLANWFTQHQNDPKVYMYDKTRYSAFAGTDLDLRLRERKIDSLHLTGVCTDICVLHTAIDAYNLNYNITVPQAAVATLTTESQMWALDHFEHVLGATIE